MGCRISCIPWGTVREVHRIFVQTSGPNLHINAVTTLSEHEIELDVSTREEQKGITNPTYANDADLVPRSQVDDMGCSFFRLRSDTGNEDNNIKNSFAGPNVLATSSPVSSVRDTDTDVVRRRQKREFIKAVSNPTYANKEEDIITSRGDSIPSLTSSSEFRDSKDNQHMKAAGEHSSSGYGGSEESGRSSLKSTTDGSSLNNCLRVDEIKERLSDIQSCSGKSSFKSSTGVLNNCLSVDEINERLGDMQSYSTTTHGPLLPEEKAGYNRHKTKLKLSQRDNLRRNFRYIKAELTNTADVVDYLIQAGDLDEDDHEEIQMAGSRTKRVDLLLRKLLTSTPTAYDHFVESLRVIGRQDMMNVLSDDNVRITELVPLNQDNAPGKESILHAKGDFLVRELKPDLILDFFFQNGTLSLDDYEFVSVRKTRKQKANKLIKLIRRKLPWGYYDLLYALSMTKTYHIIEELLVPYQGDERLNTAYRCSESLYVSCPAGSGELTMNQHGIDSSEIQIEVHLSTKNGQRLTELERRINDHLNDSEGDDIRELLLEHAKCGFVDSSMGSIIIRLRAYSSTTSVKTIQEFCSKGCMQSMIMKILKAKNLLPHLPEGEINIDFKVESFDRDGIDFEESNKDVGPNDRPQIDAVEMVRRNRSYLLEELDIFRVIKASLDKKILTDSDIQKINECAGSGRLKTTEMFLDCLLLNGNMACGQFLEVLRKMKQITVLHHLQRNDSYSGKLCALKDNLVAHFQMVADEIDPMDFEEIFIERGILTRKYFCSLRERFSSNRRNRAIYFIKSILDQGPDEFKAFVDGLVQEGHDHIVKMLCDTTVIKEDNPNLEEYNLEADFEIQEVSVEETIDKGAICSGTVEVIVKREKNRAVENKVAEETDVEYRDGISSKGKDNKVDDDSNDVDEGTEITETFPEYNLIKMGHRINRENRPKTLPIRTSGDANDTAGPDPPNKIQKAYTFPKHRKDDADNTEAISPLTPRDSGYMGSQSSKQNLTHIV
ncbi:hypothetical protein CHS0354_036861 [Potamilus streckersoni]|uniref:CARD domain-containing protein n=1 Tax=Potamilus streckersoni TaxID=2493646 RepID=A0AAE0S102_9BIVA|nr:hypothetical protein CHS0354_036861 [Potamilus streckersoni]